MGLIMSPGDVKGQLFNMNSNLDIVVTNGKALQDKIDAFSQTTGELKGESYNNIRGYYSKTHLPTIRGMICYAEELKASNDNYGTQIDTYLGRIAYVDEDALHNSLITIIDTRNQISAMNTVEHAFNSMDASLAGMQRGLEDKLRLIAEFKNSTSAIFNGITASASQVQLGISCMEGVLYNSGTNTFNMQAIDLSWNKDLNQKWDKRKEELTEKVKDQLKDIEDRIPNVSEEELQKLLELTKQVDVEVSDKLFEFMSDAVPDLFESLGVAIVKNGNRYLMTAVQGPASANSFLMLNSATAMQGSNMVRIGSNIAKVGKYAGTTLAVGAFVWGVYDDVKNQNKTIGQAVTHNAFTTVASVGASLAMTTFLAGTPVGWAVLGGAAAGVFIGGIASFIYDNNLLGIKDGLDYLGDKIDSGLKKAGEFIGDAAESIGKAINPLNWFE